MTYQGQLPSPACTVDPALVQEFVAGTLDEPGQAELAEQIARLVAFHTELPNPIVARMSRVMTYLGSETGLVAWLERFPGRPRIVARLYSLTQVLDWFSAEPAVVTALAELRAGTPYPPGLADCLTPDTDQRTLTGLAWCVESQVANDQVPDAVRLALAIVDLLDRIVPRVRELDPTLRDLRDLADTLRANIIAASAVRPSPARTPPR